MNTLDVSKSSSESEDSDLPTYKKILLAETSSEKLVAKFCSEDSRLLSSDAKDKEFAFGDCVRRLKEGYKVHTIDYLTKKLKDARITVTGKELLITYGRNTIKEPFSKLKGVLIGSSSSTFKIYSERNAKSGGVVYEETDCMSILGELRSFDIISKSPLARYDIYIGLSWYIAGACPKSSVIPLSKSRLTQHLVRMKLIEEADRKYLFFKELILLGIMKYLIKSGAPQEKKIVLKNLLDRKFRLPDKIFRISYKMKPQSFRMSDSFKEKYADTMRVRELMARMAFNIRETVYPTSGNALQVERKTTLREDILQFTDIGSIKRLATSFIDKELLNTLNESIRSKRSYNETNN